MSRSLPGLTLGLKINSGEVTSYIDNVKVGTINNVSFNGGELCVYIEGISRVVLNTYLPYEHWDAYCKYRLSGFESNMATLNNVSIWRTYYATGSQYTYWLNTMGCSSDPAIYHIWGWWAPHGTEPVMRTNYVACDSVYVDYIKVTKR